MSPDTRKTHDLRIDSVQPLISPLELKAELAISAESVETVVESRRAIENIIAGRDDRMLAVVGPCSIHDPELAFDYAARLRELRERYRDRFELIMRVYFEKPRTRLGWRGLILDPHLDGSYDIQNGLRTARSVLLRITSMGLPAGSEMLDPIVPQYIDDLISWASIGARTTESQTHREMASGLSMPVGFKNGTDGSIETAVNAMASSLHPHSFIGIDHEGRICVVNTTGNQEEHLILRGGRTGPNYHEEAVEEALELLQQAGLRRAVMVDCSHGNSQKKHSRQGKVLRSVIRQRREGNRELVGFMMESNLYEGRQPIPQKRADLEYGISITDACIGWDETEELLERAYRELPSGVGV